MAPEERRIKASSNGLVVVDAIKPDPKARRIQYEGVPGCYDMSSARSVHSTCCIAQSMLLCIPFKRRAVRSRSATGTEVNRQLPMPWLSAARAEIAAVLAVARTPGQTTLWTSGYDHILTSYLVPHSKTRSLVEIRSPA